VDVSAASSEIVRRNISEVVEVISIDVLRREDSELVDVLDALRLNDSDSVTLFVSDSISAERDSDSGRILTEIDNFGMPMNNDDLQK
jgi:hypothetical protein